MFIPLLLACHGEGTTETRRHDVRIETPATIACAPEPKWERLLSQRRAGPVSPGGTSKASAAAAGADPAVLELWVAAIGPDGASATYTYAVTSGESTKSER